MTEEWRAIALCPTYEVSDLGRIRRTHTGRVLRTWICVTTGYQQIMLADRKKHSVHRLVALAFIPDIEGKPWVNHKNGDRADARASNLEWVTPSENQLDRYARGLPGTSLGKFSGEHPTSKAIVATDMKTCQTFFYEAGMDAVREGYDSSCISRCCAGQNAYHKGRYWRFAEPVQEAA